MEQYLTGIINNDRDTNYKTKINLAAGLEGTKLNGIDRTAYSALEEITKQITEANGYDFDSAYKTRMEIENSMLPQEISALPTFASGSEQIRSMVAHMTGMKYDSKTGKWIDNINNKKFNEQTGRMEYANSEFSRRVESAVTKKVMEKYLGALTARDLISMKSDTWGGIVARITMDKAAENNIDISTEDGYNAAQELAHAELRSTLETRIDKLASGNMNVDMMKEPIYKALRIGERRQELFEKRREENEKWRQGQRHKKPNGPIPSANDGDGSDDLGDNE